MGSNQRVADRDTLLHYPLRCPAPEGLVVLSSVDSIESGLVMSSLITIWAYRLLCGSRAPRLSGMLEIEGIGSEVVTVFLLTTVSLTVLSILVGAWKLTGRRPLFYDLFLVEIHSLDSRRLVQVLQLGQEFRPRGSWSDVMTRMRSRIRSRSRTSNASPDTSLGRPVSDTNVFIQSPATVMDDSTASAQSPSASTLWEIEMPSIGSNDNNTSHESQFAAAAAIAVLGQGGFQVRPGRMDVVPAGTASGSTVGVSSVGAVPSVDGEISGNSIFEGQRSHESNIVMPMNISVVTDGVENIQVNAMGSTTDENNISNHETESATVASDHSDSQESCSEGTSAAEPPPDEGDSIIRLKFLDDTQRDARATMTDTVAKFKSVHFGEAVAAGRVIRLIYQGQLLREDSRTLASYGLRDGCVVHCHISNTPYAKQVQSSSQSVVNASNIGIQDVPRANHNSSNVGVNANEFRYPRWAMGLLMLSYRFPAIGIPLDAMIRVLFDRESEVLVAEQLGVIRRAYRRFLNSIVGDTQDVQVSPFDRAADAAAMLPPQRLCLGDYLLWIFAGQFVAIWGFVYAFPQLCDSTALGLLVLLTLYFFFVVCRSRDHFVEPRLTGENASSSTNAGR
ncbi:hypothetical protein KIN20_032429 [Parelaphostrongylus tenuis]|uniref:Ubiquitin-like domain-containing protein n=1 Tax=Parelaphostrongylus tenuis TaxID=148309 RepID=A0AAD5R6W4_PARTN|nr:hypothetical protein KIN20_032429 [Parelaphostrongylus tenuis]